MKNIFDIEKFAEEFKKTIKWMLTKKHAEEIKSDLKNLKDNSRILNEDPDSFRALRTIIELIKTNGWRLKLPQNFNNQWEDFEEEYMNEGFRTQEAKEELINLVGRGRSNKIEELFRYDTLKDFTENLYQLAQQGKTMVLGEKGRDNYLRDFGYWDRIPIDRHEMRFIVRSGIYHACSSIKKSDPLEKSHLQDALKEFCAKYLKDYKVEDIKLGSAPGIVDIFIWSFSAENRYNICGTIPNCKNCPLNGVCLYCSNLRMEND